MVPGPERGAALTPFSVNGPMGHTVADMHLLLKARGKQLINAKPALHTKGFLKPVHKTPEFCGGCHKAHLPASVNDYRWLRAQNHYDSFLQSGVSGHRVDSFYYPPRATANCQACHMPRADGVRDRFLRGSTAIQELIEPMITGVMSRT